MASPLQKAFAAKQKVVIVGNHSGVAHAVIANGDLLLKEFENDVLSLKEFSRIADKIAHKRDVLLPKYQAQLDGWYQGNSNHPAIGKIILWTFDAGLIDSFLKYCDKAIAVNLPSPINRNWQTFATESIAEWALKQGEAGNSAEPYLSQIIEKLNTGEWQIFEKVAAKAYKAAGFNLLRNGEGKVNAAHIGDIAALQDAQVLLTKAKKIYDKSGVDDLINNRIPSRIRKLREYAGK